MYPNIVLNIDTTNAVVTAKSINQICDVPLHIVSRILNLCSDGAFSISRDDWQKLCSGISDFLTFTKIEKKVLFTTSLNILDEEAQPATSPSLGIWRLASFVSSKFAHVDVFVCDPNLGGIKVLEGLLRENRFDVVGLSIIPANIDSDIRLFDVLRETQKESIVVLGGVDAGSLKHMPFLEHWLVDYLVEGSGEEFFDGLLKEPQEKLTKSKTLNIYKSNLSSKPFEFDESNLPYGQGDLVHPHGYTSRTLYHKFSNACPEKCFWCVSPKDGLVYRNPDDAVASLCRRYRYGWHENISIIDNNISSHKSFILRACELLSRSEIGLVPKHTKSTINGIDDELLRAMASAGFVRVSYGVESFDTLVRSHLGKTYTNIDISQCILKTVGLGIRPEINLILCSPYETKASLSNTLNEAAYWVSEYDCLLLGILGLYCTVGTVRHPPGLKIIQKSVFYDNEELGHLPWIFEPGKEVYDLYFKALKSYNDEVSLLRARMRRPVPNHLKSLLKCLVLSREIRLDCASLFEAVIKKQWSDEYVHV